MKYKIIWSKEDLEYVATVDKYPSLSYLDPDPVVALEGIISLSIYIDKGKDA